MNSACFHSAFVRSRSCRLFRLLQLRFLSSTFCTHVLEVTNICSSRMSEDGGPLVRPLRVSHYRQRLETRDLDRCIFEGGASATLSSEFRVISFAPAFWGGLKKGDLMECAHWREADSCDVCTRRRRRSRWQSRLRSLLAAWRATLREVCR